MSTVSIREFSYNPSAMFARVERGETIEVTRNTDVIAVLLPASVAGGRYSPLAAKGLLRLKPTTTSNLDRVPTTRYPLTQNRWTCSSPRGLRMIVDLSSCAGALPSGVRTPDAVHVATAQVIGDPLDVLVTYDRHMLGVARSAGLPVATPGVL